MSCSRNLPPGELSRGPVFALPTRASSLNGSFLARAYASPVTLGSSSAMCWKAVGSSRDPARPIVAAEELRLPVGWRGRSRRRDRGHRFTCRCIERSLFPARSCRRQSRISARRLRVRARWLIFRALAALPAPGAHVADGRLELIVDLASTSTRTDTSGGPPSPRSRSSIRDFECPFCGQAEPVMRELVRDFGSALRLRTSIDRCDRNAQLAAKRASCAEQALSADARPPLRHQAHCDRSTSTATRSSWDSTRSFARACASITWRRAWRDGGDTTGDLSGVSELPRSSSTASVTMAPTTSKRCRRGARAKSRQLAHAAVRAGGGGLTRAFARIRRRRLGHSVAPSRLPFKDRRLGRYIHATSPSVRFRQRSRVRRRVRNPSTRGCSRTPADGERALARSSARKSAGADGAWLLHARRSFAQRSVISDVPSCRRDRSVQCSSSGAAGLAQRAGECPLPAGETRSTVRSLPAAKL